MRKSLFVAALSLLVLPAATAFASEGTFEPAVVASPASGATASAPIGGSFVYSQGDGGQNPAFPRGANAHDTARMGISAGAFSYNAGSNG
jgi:hypothetical protein